MKFAIPLMFVVHVLGAQAPDRYQDMKVVRIAPLVSRVDAAKGIVWKQVIEVPEKDAVAIRVHLSVRKPLPTPDWAIRIRDLAGRHVDTFQGNSPLLSTRDVWSSEIADRGAIVELLADIEGIDPAIVVDAYAYRTRAKSSAGPVTLIPIVKAAYDVQAMAEPIARLRFIDEGQQYTCTGFLVHRTLMMTAGSCVRSDAAALSMIADFGLDNERAKPRSFRVKKIEVSNPSLDYAVLRLADAPDGFNPATLSDGRAEIGQRVLVIQHVGGGAKQVSGECKVANAALQGAGSALSDFGYDCTTGAGSSGSPVVDPRSGRVLGLHRLRGINAGEWKQAVHAGQILADLKQSVPRIYEELMAPLPKK
jgi:hypothetical protein